MCCVLFKNKLNQIERNEKRQNIKAFKNEIIDRKTNVKNYLKNINNMKKPRSTLLNVLCMDLNGMSHTHVRNVIIIIYFYMINKLMIEAH